MKPKLLIVDDDEDIRAQMKWALTKEYEIVMAGDRESALDVFRTERPAVVLLDLGLPPHPGTPQEGLATLADGVVDAVEACGAILEEHHPPPVS